MKKPISNSTALIMTLFACTFLATGCSSVKKIKEESTIVKTNDQLKDSIKTTLTNQPIDDKLITPIVQSHTGNPVLDSLVNVKVDEILSKLNTSKKSGDNSYQLLYDAITKQLEFNAKIASTKNESTAVRNEKATTSETVKKTPVYVEKPLSKVEKGLMILGIVGLVFIGFKIVGFIRKNTILWH